MTTTQPNILTRLEAARKETDNYSFIADSDFNKNLDVVELSTVNRILDLAIADIKTKMLTSEETTKLHHAINFHPKLLYEKEIKDKLKSFTLPSNVMHDVPKNINVFSSEGGKT